MRIIVEKITQDERIKRLDDKIKESFKWEGAGYYKEEIRYRWF